MPVSHKLTWAVTPAGTFAQYSQAEPMTLRHLQRCEACRWSIIEEIETMQGASCGKPPQQLIEALAAFALANISPLVRGSEELEF